MNKIHWIMRLFLLIAALAAISQSSAKDVPVKEDTIKIAVNGGSIEGNLLQAANSHALVIIVPGSGPTDRNGNSPALKGKNNFYKQIAEHLAANGISSFRYDKRGAGKGLALIKSEFTLRFDDYAADLVTIIDSLNHAYHFPKVFVAGHSEGSLVGMIACTQRKVSGYISLAGGARSIGEILRDQLKALPDSLQPAINNIIDHLKQGDTVNKVPARLWSMLRPSVQPYMISWMKYVPTEVIAKLTIPILIVQGTTDIQVAYTEAENLYKANPGRSTLTIIKGVNHLFREAPLDRELNFNTYSNPDLQAPPQLMESIISFINNNKGK